MYGKYDQIQKRICQQSTRIGYADVSTQVRLQVRLYLHEVSSVGLPSKFNNHLGKGI